ncbi:hypothetical protein BDZ94DRAFT_1257835 [Collybia nuda]|uniref:Uncharacterized protein n=1 Tax=Collybia nuda TaxID=64659 RepID=A0A9P6CJ41_9AGAR|nr:hypothetical protein BDZ94DRAFT_1257835 [Collybia nuda]
MLSMGHEHTTPILGWTNVALGLSFILFDVFVSNIFGLGIGQSMLISAFRCVLQLGVVAVLLERVFATENPWAVAGIAFLLNLLGTFEIVVNKSTRRHHYMFPSVLVGLLGSTIPISILGSRFAMSVQPFWEPVQYIPVVGMLCGSAISGMVLTLNYLLRELQDNRDKVEVYLAFGATRMEACRPIAIEALKIALTPVINQMSVLGIIAIPGMMTGAILGGASVQQAAKLQMIIVFMLSSATCLSAVFTTIAVVSVTVDSDHRIRMDRVDDRKHGIWRARERMGKTLMILLKKLVCGWREKGTDTLSERTPLITGE